MLFTNQTKPLHFSYQRFLENRLRAAFDFTGTPIRFTQRLKKRDAPGRRDRELRQADESTRHGTAKSASGTPSRRSAVPHADRL